MWFRLAALLLLFAIEPMALASKSLWVAAVALREATRRLKQAVKGGEQSLAISRLSHSLIFAICYPRILRMQEPGSRPGPRAW